MAPAPSLTEKLRPWFASSSLAAPTAADETATRALQAFLDTEAPLESEQDRAGRERLLVSLRRLMAEWVRATCVREGVPEEDAPSGRLFVSGSYRLGVNQKGADIDTILVVPAHVHREDFFDETRAGLVGRLRAHPSVSHVLPIPSAKVPIIEVVWDGIELDVLFARLDQTSRLPETPDDLLDDSLLLRADEATILSLNGPRVTELIVKLVPNYDTFVLVLRALRLWAKRRGIYSNKMGFLGGVNFAILATFACQIWPRETASRCLTRLMVLVSEWKWPAPIRLCHPYELEGGALDSLPQWDPSNMVGVRDRMPIITPAYPNSNSAYNVTAATLDVMRDEFCRGKTEATQALKQGTAMQPEDWSSFFAPSNFFVRFSVYIAIVAEAPDATALKKWTGYVESRIRKFVENLERMPLFEIFPFPTGFDAPDRTRTTPTSASPSSSSTSTSNNNKEDEVVVDDAAKAETNGEEAKEDDGDNNVKEEEKEKEEEEEEEQQSSVLAKRWFVGVRVDQNHVSRSFAASLTNKTVNLEGAVIPFLSNTLDWEERSEGMNADVRIMKFVDMLRTFPDMYAKVPGGIPEALRQHDELLREAKKGMSQDSGKARAASTAAAANGATSPKAGSASQGDMDGSMGDGSGEDNDASDAALSAITDDDGNFAGAFAMQNLAAERLRRKRERMDMTTIPELPISRSVAMARAQMVPANWAAAARPSPLKVVVANEPPPAATA